MDKNVDVKTLGNAHNAYKDARLIVTELHTTVNTFGKLLVKAVSSL